jgi:adenosyl cobinamide kinase/adenosyl cobinamide phosphate guanylyltransferase
MRHLVSAARVLVLGGRRSGKSRYALERARDMGGDAVTFVATARAGDAELDARIAAHRAQRPAQWRTLEVERDLAHPLAGVGAEQVLLVDSLTLWASSLTEDEEGVREQWPSVAAALGGRRAVFVSEEAGMGIVPLGEMTRRFLDDLGWLNQQVAQLADEVILMVAGIPVPIKGARR